MGLAPIWIFGYNWFYMAKRRIGWQNNKAAENGKKGGRPIGTVGEEKLARIAFKQKFVDFVQSNAEKILKAQLDLALGVYEEKEDAMGNIRVYKRRPDGYALGSMIDQVIGRAPQKIEVEAEIETSAKPMAQEQIDLIAQGVAMAMPEYVEKHQTKKDTDTGGAD